METLGLVIARAGSKGLPGKNALDVAGKPMLGWTLAHALCSKSLDRVALSTDGEQLAAIAREHDVEVVMRPASLASDTATVDAAARHAVEALESQHDVTFSHIAILYGNVPCRPADLTDRAMARLKASGADSVQSVCPVGKMHPYWMKQLGGEQGDRLEYYQPNNIYRRQELPPVYMLDGGVLAVTRESLFIVREGEPHAFLGKDQRAVVTQPGEVVDVDSEVDLRVAEAMLQGQGA